MAREKTGYVTFIVESEQIHAHRNVLAALSPKYEAQFYGNQADERDIYVEDISTASFNEFIKLFYLGKADFTLENIEDIINLSKQCLVNAFVVKCKNFLQSRISKQNVCWIYQVAILYDVQAVLVSCEIFIGEHLPELLSSDDFLEIDHDTLLRILGIEPLYCQEIDVFEGCIKWARAACQQKNLGDTETGKLRAELGDAVTQFRFKSMKLHDFVKLNETYKGFFSAEEFIEITNIIGGLLNFTPRKFNNTRRSGNLFTINGTAIAKYQTQSGIDNNISTTWHCITAMKECKASLGRLLGES